MKKRQAQICALLLLGVLTPLSAAGAPEPTPTARKGVIIQIMEDQRIMVDLGEADGVGPGTPIKIFSKVSMVHPVTGQEVQDLILLGQEEASQTGRRLSIIHLQRLPQSRLKIGDVVSLVPGRKKPEPKAAAVPGSAMKDCPVCVGDKDAMSIHRAWLATRGKPLDDRLSLWRIFLKGSSKNRYKDRIKDQVDFLSARVEEKKRALAKAHPPVRAIHDPPDGLVRDETFRPVISVTSDQTVMGVVLYYRTDGEKLYRAVNMDPVGDNSWGCLVTGATSGSRLEYHLEASFAGGRQRSVFASAVSPHEVRVVPPVVDAKPDTGRSEANSRFEWVDFYNDRPSTDYYWRVEMDYRHRLDLRYLSSFRMGFGIFEGEGGSAWIIEDSSRGSEERTRVAITYAYFEGELAISQSVAFMPRLLFGEVREHHSGVQSEVPVGDRAVGFQGFFRIGQENATHLVFGGGGMQQLGIQGLLKMNLALIPRFPLGLSAMATNLPVGEDYAARMLLNAGWQANDKLTLTGDFGVNMRNIRHIGIGGGLGLSLRW